MNPVLSVLGYLLGAVWIFLGIRDGAPLKFAVAAVWFAWGVKYMRAYCMDKENKDMEENDDG